MITYFYLYPDIVVYAWVFENMAVLHLCIAKYASVLLWSSVDRGLLLAYKNTNNLKNP